MYVHEMFNHLLYTYCKRSHIALGIPLLNININQKTKILKKKTYKYKAKRLFLFRDKKMVKNNP